LIPRRVKIATVLAFGLHGILILTARYRLSYDAYNHMFFADHYRLNWWSLWEPRWYTGFEVVSYPPLVHQLMALLGRIVGVDAAFALILWSVLTAYPVAVYFFTRIFVGHTAACYSAIGAALLPSLYLTAHVFGQLPTLFATLLALFGAAVLADFLQDGGALTGGLAVCLFATVMAAHHATLLFLPPLVGAVFLKFFLDKNLNKRALFFRLFIFAALAILAGWLVIFPFWQWGAQQTLQTTIDHASRHNFFRDPFAAVLFFLPMYGLLIPLIPIAIWMGRRKRFWGPGLAFTLLFLLGLGDTTPLPRLLFGPGWAWLTYDRFAFWASLVLLVFFGAAVVMLRHKLRSMTGDFYHRETETQSLLSSPSLWLHSSVIRFMPFADALANFSFRLRRKLVPFRRRRPHWESVSEVIHYQNRVDFWLNHLFLVSMTFIALLIGLIPTWLPTQPAQLDMRPIVAFLDQADHSYWRYVTFGFGDQLAYLSRLTNATTIDGSYHTARSLPELRASGIGQIDTAYWIPGGLAALDPILQKSGARGVRWGFVNSKFFVPTLLRNGWHQIATLSNGVAVWENPSASFPAQAKPPVERPFTAFAWGTFPLFALVMSGGLALRRYRFALSQRILPGIQAMAIGLLPVGLTFWSYRTLFPLPHERIYFTYSDALFFLSDGIALVAVLAWQVNKIQMAPTPRSSPNQKTGFGEGAWLFTLCLLASLSTLWSLDWRISLYISLHTWLVFGLYLSLRERPQAWRPFAMGAVAALFLQILIGIWQVAVQATASTMALGLDWPGNLLPSMRGASVVQLADGARWLRAYGTLPHPNLLGGWTLVLLASLLTLILLPSKGRIPALILFNAGLVLLVLTFSRSAWLGLAMFVAVLLIRWKRLDRKSLLLLASSGLLCLALLVLPLRPLFFTRLVDNQVQTEQVSNFTRFWLVQRTWEIIRQKPFLGVGIGSYSLALSQHVADFYKIEPVHNLPLLVWSELGIFGLLTLIGLVATVVIRSFRARRPLTILFSAVLAGLFLVSFFDHYLWTLAPGRLLFASVLGLWSGQVRDERGG
jgi:O-Antigen ligase